MRIYRVVCSPTAHELAHEGQPGDGYWARTLDAVGVSYEVVESCVDIGDERGPGVLGVGSIPNDVWLREHVEVYLHVGEMADVGSKRGEAGHITVPVVRQWGPGVRNALRWVIASAAEGASIAQHRDIAGHAMACASSYSLPRKVELAEQTVREAAAELRETFAQLRGVFGTGFPFYCTLDSADPAAARIAVPDSIRRFTVTQADEFVGRLVRTGAEHSTVYTREQLEGSGMALNPTSYTAYEYTRWGAQPPAAPAEGTLEEFVEANVLDHSDRAWPCQLCTTLADRAQFPEQRWERDFMTTCVSCGQTPFLPRAVGVLGSDIDIVALVDDATGADAVELAGEIARWIDVHPQYLRHDTEWAAQLFGAHGPLDVFVVSTEAFFATVEAMAADSSTWLSRTVTATVTWLPVTTIAYELGKYFALCMEPLDVDPDLEERLADGRRQLANAVGADEVIAAYDGDSFYLRQLMENAEVRGVIQRRFAQWAGVESAGTYSSQRTS